MHLDIHFQTEFLYSVEFSGLALHKLELHGIIVSKLNWQTITSEFETHRVLLTSGLLPQLNKNLVNN